MGLAIERPTSERKIPRSQVEPCQTDEGMLPKVGAFLFACMPLRSALGVSVPHGASVLCEALFKNLKSVSKIA